MQLASSCILLQSSPAITFKSVESAAKLSCLLSLYKSIGLVICAHRRIVSHVARLFGTLKPKQWSYMADTIRHPQQSYGYRRGARRNAWAAICFRQANNREAPTSLSGSTSHRMPPPPISSLNACCPRLLFGSPVEAMDGLDGGWPSTVLPAFSYSESTCVGCIEECAGHHSMRLAAPHSLLPEALWASQQAQLLKAQSTSLD